MPVFWRRRWSGQARRQAQTYVTPSSEVAATASGYFPGGGYGYGGYHSSTAEEGVLTGLGYLTRSMGEANYFHSLAAINGQEAYNRYLQNREKATETYFRMQQINRAAREASGRSRCRSNGMWRWPSSRPRTR